MILSSLIQPDYTRLWTKLTSYLMKVSSEGPQANAWHVKFPLIWTRLREIRPVPLMWGDVFPFLVNILIVNLTDKCPDKNMICGFSA